MESARAYYLESWFVYTCFGATRQMWTLLLVVALNVISMYLINYYSILNLSMYRGVYPCTSSYI